MRLQNKTVVVAIRMPESERDRFNQEAEDAGFDSTSTYLRALLGVRHAEDAPTGSLLHRIETLERRVAALEGSSSPPDG